MVTTSPPPKWYNHCISLTKGSLISTSFPSRILTRLKLAARWCPIGNRIHGTRISTYMNSWFLWMANVGKCTSPMDPMGTNIYPPHNIFWIGFCWWIFYGLYHGKSSLNHHLAEYFFSFLNGLQINTIITSRIPTWYSKLFVPKDLIQNRFHLIQTWFLPSQLTNWPEHGWFRSWFSFWVDFGLFTGGKYLL